MFPAKATVHGRGQTLVVGRNEERRAVAVESRKDARLHGPAGGSVELARWIVGENDLGIGHQGAGERDTLYLATGQIVRPFVGKIAEGQKIESLVSG